MSNEDAPWRAEKMLWREWALYKGTGMSLEEFRSSGNYHGFSIPELQQRKAAIVPRDTSGDCHRLQSITLEITNEPVTEGKVEAVLGWLDKIWPNRLDGQRFETIQSENRFANSLSTGSFTTESFK